MSEKREALAAYLRGHGILHAAPGQPIRHANGAPAPWAFYSWNTTLTAEGLRLTAACILERLAGFKARQIASIGYTGIPLAAACVLQGEGRYTGLCIRDKRKTYVSCRQVEGPFDRSAPVVIVDDSISSGNSLAKAIRAIEAEGGEVEGAIALVQFPYRGGLNWANKAGYRAEALFDIWADLDMARTLDRPAAPFAPKFGEVSAPENLHPAALARFAARIWAATGRAPRPRAGWTVITTAKAVSSSASGSGRMMSGALAAVFGTLIRQRPSRATTLFWRQSIHCGWRRSDSRRRYFRV